MQMEVVRKMNGLFDYRNWMRPSHATGWLSLGAFQFYAIVLVLGWLVYGGLHWLFHALGGAMQ